MTQKQGKITTVIILILFGGILTIYTVNKQHNDYYTPKQFKELSLDERKINILMTSSDEELKTILPGIIFFEDGSFKIKDNNYYMKEFIEDAKNNGYNVNDDGEIINPDKQIIDDFNNKFTTTH